MKIPISIVVLLALYQLGFGQKTEIETKLNGVTVRSIQGKEMVDYDLLSKFKRKIVIIEFWETWCRGCIEGMSHLRKLQNKYPNDLKVICISSDGFEKTVNYISKNTLPFDFIFDEQKKMHTIFPHSEIPYSVIIDKNGKVQAETYPYYITEIQIEQMILGKSIDVPLVKNFDKNDLGKKKSQTSLVSFDLQRSELGEGPYLKASQYQNKVRIVTGYKANSFIDTVETVKEYIAGSKSILELYQLAYNDVQATRFIFSNELDYIKSSQPNCLYNLNFAISNLLGDFNTVLTNQLNSSFGFDTQKIKKDTIALVLKKVVLNGNSIKLANLKKERALETYISNYEFFRINGNQINVHEIAYYIGTKTKLLVEVENEEDLNYELNINMDKPTTNINEWLSYFEKEGLYLVQEKRTVEFIKIRKAFYN